MKIIFKKPDLSFVLFTIKDLFSKNAWKSHKWFRHLLAVICIVYALRNLYLFDNLNFWSELFLRSLFYSILFAIGWEFLQGLYINFRYKRSLTEKEFLESKMDAFTTSIFFTIITFIFLSYGRQF